MGKLTREDLELMKKRLYEFGIFPAKTVNTALSLYSELDELKKALNIYDTNLILEVKEVNRVKDELEEIKARVREVKKKYERRLNHNVFYTDKLIYKEFIADLSAIGKGERCSE